MKHLTFSAAAFKFLTSDASKIQKIMEYDKISITCADVTILLTLTLLRWFSLSLEFKSGNDGLNSVIFTIKRKISINKTQEVQQINAVQ